uniref:ArfGAP with RhoGAP domain, ankyrin repeat and PH domain 3 n=1 Tax=Myripristis murdjan TaxID=586833 RepID=A0A668AJH0_9TELE
DHRPRDLMPAVCLCVYVDTFRRAGLLLARDFTHLDHDALVSLGIIATGHRKRILRLVGHIQRTNERSVTAGPRAKAVVKPVPKPRTVFNRRRTTPIHFSCSAPDPVPPPPRRLSQESICFTILEGLNSGDTPASAAGDRSASNAAKRRSSQADRRPRRSSSLSDSVGGSLPPVPPRLNRGVSPATLQGSPPSSSSARSDQDQARLSQALHPGDSQGYSTVGELSPPQRCLSLPPHLCHAEPDDDLTISPYASYTSLSERAAPIICGWLDKLSPQGNYVFQKRYVKFDGKNLMYFGSEKDVYPKGVIPLAAIQMARPAKDNKFEIVTSHRIFVFRTDNEVLRQRWVGTLQGRVKEQLVFGRPRFGPGAHCQKHGFLELKGTKSKVYAAINTEQIWLYKSEQCFRNGIGITLIEARGATIRDGKHKSFDLITPYKTFSFTAESDRDKRDWMEALQESIAETLSDYEVAEKIWSNRSNRMCADCKAINPDWASINLCVVICKNCAGQHRGLGTMVSKVQSLKLDTSVWSNEIVQLFIMLGNDRANEFWASRLSLSEELDCDATPEQRREFITQKYREGRFRRAHPGFGSQDELLKVRRRHSRTSPKNTDERNWETKSRPEWEVISPSLVPLTLARPLQAATPLSCHCLLTREFERVGLLRYKAMLDPQQWKEAYFVLQKSNLFICPGNDGAAEDIINLNRLQELSEYPGPVRLRTLHLQGMGRTDFSLWYSDIQRAAGGRGNTLREQQLSRNDIPIIVDSCIAFITQYGLGHEGIYRKNGAKSRIKLLMEEFRKDARNVKLRIGDHFIEDVTDVLKRFFREIDDPIFMADLHPLWKEAAKIPQRSQRLDRYKEIIRSLPRVNRTTLAALISHLYRVQKCADLNQMCTKNLSLLFAPSLFQTDGKGEHEVKIMEDLIDNYLYVFDEHQTQIELEISLITTWKDTQLSQAGDLIIEVYLEMKIPDCCITLKVSPTMCAEELTNQVLYMRNVPAGDRDVWMTFEAIEDGQLERPLHPKEKVLEQALQWCKMADPSSAYLVVKRVPKGEGINILTSYKSEIMKVGLLRCREEPPKLLQGNKFQERTFQIRDHKLLLLKDKKSIKPEKEWALNRSLQKTSSRYKTYRHKLILKNKSLNCSCPLQNDDPGPPVLRRHSSADISKQKFGTMPLVPIRGDESNSTMLSANQTLVRAGAQPSFHVPPQKTEKIPTSPSQEQ